MGRYDSDGPSSVLDRSKRLVNVVNMVNVAEHGMSYATPNPADDMPRRPGYLAMIETARADIACDRTN